MANQIVVKKCAEKGCREDVFTFRNTQRYCMKHTEERRQEFYHEHREMLKQ